MYNEVINEMSKRTSSSERVLRSSHHANVETIVPAGSRSVVLISSRSRHSDCWDEHEHENSVDSGLHTDADCSKNDCSDGELHADVTVTTGKVAFALFSPLTAYRLAFLAVPK